MKKNKINSMSEKLTHWNKNDSRILIPKAAPGVGWRVNFGNPKAIILLTLTLVVIVGLLIALVVIFGN